MYIDRAGQRSHVRGRREEPSAWERVGPAATRATVMADYKEQGNHFFSDKKYDQAISCYSKAIVSFVCMRVV